MMRGLFITFEGGTCGDRTRQVRRLAVRLRNEGIEVLEIPATGAVGGGAAITDLLNLSRPGQWSAEAKALLMFAAARDLLEKVIRPTLLRGRWIIGAGSTDPTRAPLPARSGTTAALIELVDDAVFGGDRPNLTFVLEKATNPLSEEGGSASPQGGILSVSQRTRQGQLRQMVWRDPERCRFLNSADDDDTIAETVWNAILSYNGNEDVRRLGSVPIKLAAEAGP